MLAPAVLLLMIGARTVSAQNACADRVRVEEVVGWYFAGLAREDPGEVKRAFHPDALLLWTDAFGGLKVETQSSWYKTFTPDRPPSPPPPMRIVSVDCTGTAAVVKTELEYPRNWFTDYIALLKVNGQWTIVSKIYDAAPKTSK